MIGDKRNFSLSLWDHKDNFLCLLKSANEEINGQSYDEQLIKNIYGEQTLNFNIPAYIFDTEAKNSSTDGFIKNEKWNYIFNEQKIRYVKYDNITNKPIETKEFILKNHTESRDGYDKIISCQCESLATYELAKIGWNINFDIDYVTKYESEQNKPDLITLDYWLKKIFYKETHLGRVSTTTECTYLLQEMQLRDEEGYPISSEYTIDEEGNYKYLYVDEPICNSITTLQEHYNPAGWHWEVQSLYKNDPSQTSLTTILYEEPTINVYNEVYPNQYKAFSYQKIIGEPDSTKELKPYPIKEQNYGRFQYVTDIKKRLIKAERSNIFSIIQTLCETFEVWAYFEYQYDAKGRIIDRKILFKTEAINDDIKFDFSYGKNLLSCSRNIDSNELITKLTIPDTDSSLDSDRVLSIKQASANPTGENYLYNFEYFYNLGILTRGEDNDDSDEFKINLHNGTLKNCNNAINRVQKTLVPLYDRKSSLEADLEVQQASYTAIIENIQSIQDKIDAIPANEREISSWSQDITQYNYIGELKTVSTTTINGETKYYIDFGRNDILYNKNISVIACQFDANNNLIDGEQISISSYIPRYYTSEFWNVGTTTYDRDFTLFNSSNGKPDYGDDESLNYIKGFYFNNPIRSYIRVKYKYAPLAYYYTLMRQYYNKLVSLHKDIEKLKNDIQDIKNKIFVYELNLSNLLLNKNRIILEFEKKYKNFIREGYWEPSNYQSQINSKTLDTNNPTSKFEGLITITTKLSDLNLNDSLHNYSYYINLNVSANNIDIDSISMTTANPEQQTINTQLPRYRGNDYEVFLSNNNNVILGISPNLIDSYNTHNYNNNYYKSTVSYSTGGENISNEYNWIHFDEQNSPNTQEKYIYLTNDNILTDENLKVYGDSINNDNLLEWNVDYTYLFDYAGYDSQGHRIPLDEQSSYSEDIHYDYIIKIILKNTNKVNSYSKYIVTYNEETTLQFLYNDAVKTSQKYSVPQITYSVSVLDLSSLEGYENYEPILGQKVPIYDSEMGLFGYEGIITSISKVLEKPEETNIEIATYQSRFEDIFQKLTSTMTEVKYNESELLNAANAITEFGTVKEQVFQKSLDTNNFQIQLGTNNDITIDKKTGITLVDEDNYSAVKIIGNGIFLTEDYRGNNSEWKTGITGNGINANALTAGNIDTKNINIWNASEGQIRFIWNEQGLFAFGASGVTGTSGSTKQDFIDYNKYVKFNYDGLKFKDGDRSALSLGWDGLKMDTLSGALKLDADEGLILRKNGLENSVTRLKLGKISNSTSDNYGLKLYDSSGSTSFQSDSDGNLWLSKYINIGGEFSEIQEIPLEPTAGIMGENNVPYKYQMGIMRDLNGNVYWNTKPIRFWAGPQSYLQYLENVQITSEEINSATTITSQILNSITTNDPTLARFKVDSEGNIVASGIDVGGWIGSGKLLRSKNNEAILRSDGYTTATPNYPVIAVGKSTTTNIDGRDYNFRVYQDGSVNINKGTIHIGDGTVGGWTATSTGLSVVTSNGKNGTYLLSSTTLSGTTFQSGSTKNPSFYVQNNGHVYARDLSIEGGSINIFGSGLSVGSNGTSISTNGFQTDSNGTSISTSGFQTDSNGTLISGDSANISIGGLISNSTQTSLSTNSFKTDMSNSTYLYTGEVAGWTATTTGLEIITNSSTTTFKTAMYSKKDYSATTFQSGPSIAPTFVVKNDGTVLADNIKITGKALSKSTDKIIDANETFTVTKDGKVTATAGNIAGWNISSSTLSTTIKVNNKNYYEGIQKPTTSTDIVFYAGENKNTPKFRVLADGTLYAEDAVISGTVEAKVGGEIAGFTIGENALWNGKSNFLTTDGGIYIGTDGISLGKNNNDPAFKVDKNGYLEVNNVKITGAQVPTYDTKVLEFTDANNQVIFSVTKEGKLSAKSGDIAGWEFNNNKFYKNNTSSNEVELIKYNGYINATSHKMATGNFLTVYAQITNGLTYTFIKGNTDRFRYGFTQTEPTTNVLVEPFFQEDNISTTTFTAKENWNYFVAYILRSSDSHWSEDYKNYQLILNNNTNNFEVGLNIPKVLQDKVFYAGVPGYPDFYVLADGSVHASKLDISTGNLGNAFSNVNNNINLLSSSISTNINSLSAAINLKIESLSTSIDQDINSISSALVGQISSLSTNINTLVNGLMDTRVEIWYESGKPLTTTAPTNSWTTSSLKNNHINDLYYNIDTGEAFRYVKQNSQYVWKPIPEYSVTAQELATQAKSIADKKRTVYTDTPKGPYDIGDLWIFNDTGYEIKYCISATTVKDGFNSNDWQLAATDNTVANSNIKRSIQLWYAKTNTTKPGKPTKKITSTATTGGGWRTVVPVYSSEYQHYYYCWQYEFADGSVDWSDVVYDNSISGLRDNLSGIITTQINSLTTDINNSIKALSDERVEIWYKSGKPFTTTAPTNSWTTNSIKDLHIGDLYYNTDTGEAFNYTKNGSNYVWVSIPEYSATAQELATQAKNIADGKRTVFTTTEPPVSPYDMGDLWINTSTMLVKYAISKTTTVGKRNINDWADTIGNKAIKSSSQLWFATTTDVNSPSKPKANTTIYNSATTYGKWNRAIPIYTSTNPHYYYCWEYVDGEGVTTWSAVAYNGTFKSIEDLAADNLGNFIVNTYDPMINALTTQVDNQIDVWYKTVDATTSIEPFKNWNNTTKELHIGDLYFNTNNGKSWRYNKSGATYLWTQMPENSDTLASISTAQATADEKIVVFSNTTQPHPYDIGDLWIKDITENNKTRKQIWYATTTRATYVAEDWVLTATDDSLAKENIKSTRLVWFASSTTAVPKIYTTTSILDADRYEKWTYKVPSYSTKKPYYFYANQYTHGDNSIEYSSVVLDKIYYELEHKASNDLSNFITSYSTLIQGITTQIDNQLEIWYGTDTPSFTTEPSIAWSTNDSLQQLHENDLYINTSTGYNWRFRYKTGNQSYWELLPEDERIRTSIQSVESTLDGKRTVFATSKVPVSPYDIGDLWINTSTMLVKYAISKTTTVGKRNESDWADTIGNKTLKSSIQLWYTSNTTKAPSKPTTEISSTTTAGKKWSTVVPDYSTTNSYYYYCWQYKFADGSIDWSNVVLDKSISGIKDNLSQYLSGELESLKDQIDNQIDVWYGTDTPSFTTEPSIAWSTNDSLQQLHKDDLYINTSTGQNWRFIYRTNNQSYWKLLPENISTLESISTVQGIADGKRRVFIDTPTPPYDMGDLWIKDITENNKTRKEIWYATTTRATYSANDWVLTATDNSRAEEAITLTQSTVTDVSQLWKCSDTTASFTTGFPKKGNANGWSTTIPAYSTKVPYYHYCWQYEVKNGNTSFTTFYPKKSYYDRITSENSEKVGNNISSSKIIWYASASTTIPSISTNNIIYNGKDLYEYWTIVKPSYSTTYPYYYYCYMFNTLNSNTTFTEVFNDTNYSLSGFDTRNLGIRQSYSTYYLGMKPPTSGGSDIVIWAGTKGEANSNNEFTVKANGAVKATNADILGTIKAKAGYIGGAEGFSISDNKIYNGKESLEQANQGVYIGTDGISVGTNTKVFKATSTGIITAKGLIVDGGSISIGNFNVTSTSVSLSTNNISFTTPSFIINNNNSNFISGTVAGWKATNNTLQITAISNNTTYGTLLQATTKADGVAIQAGKINEPAFTVKNNGAVYASNLNITGGSIKIGGANGISLSTGSTFGNIVYNREGTSWSTSTAVISSTSGTISISTQDIYISGTTYNLLGGGYISGWEATSTALRIINDNYLVQLYAGSVSTDRIIAAGSFTTGANNVINFNNPSFYVRNDGYLYSKSGNIGGWTLTDSGFSKTLYDNNNKFICAAGIFPRTTTTQPVFFTGTTTRNGYREFEVYPDGRVRATKLEIQKQGTSYYAGINNPSKPDDPVFCAGTTSLSTNYNFYVTANGKIKAKSGEIGDWKIGNSGQLYYDSDGVRTIFSPKNTGNSTKDVIYVGDKDRNDPKFKVTGTGDVYFRGNIYSYYGGWQRGVDSANIVFSDTTGAWTNIVVAQGIIVGTYQGA